MAWILVVALTATSLHATRAEAATRCEFEDGTMTIVLDRGDGAVRVVRGPRGAIRYHVLDQVFTFEEGHDCGRPAATVRNTDAIVVVARGREYAPSVVLDMGNGRFGPGASREAGIAEVEIRMDFGGAAGVHLYVYGGDRADAFYAGRRGIALNADGDADVTGFPRDAENPSVLGLSGGEGDDHLSTLGGFGTGGPAGWARPGLSGWLGDDTLVGGPHRSTLVGGDGGDVLKGGDDDDFLEGGRGPDVMEGGAGADTLDYTSSLDAVDVDLVSGIGRGGDAEGDLVSGAEHIEGSPNGDRLKGDDGTNRLWGGYGYDWLAGRGGDDFLTGGDLRHHTDIPGDEIDGGPGSDWSMYEGTWGVEVNLATGEQRAPETYNDTLISIENLHGTSSNDKLVGDDGPNVLEGGAGDDVLTGGNGDDVEYGGDGDDVLYEGTAPNGADELYGDKPFSAWTGHDRVDYSDRTGAVSVTRDDQPNDGEPGERDNVHSDTEAP